MELRQSHISPYTIFDTRSKQNAQQNGYLSANKKALHAHVC